jgi:hypothetical protein
MQKPIQLPHLKNLYKQFSLKRKVVLLEQCLGSSIWSAIALELNYKIVQDLPARKYKAK